MKTNFYPKSPVNTSGNLTALTPSYQLRAIFAILAILLFFALYGAMIVGLGYLLYYAISYNMVSVNRITLLMKFGAVVGAGMLFIFTLKFILKLKNHTPKNRIKLIKDKQPELWMFIDKICNETGAPKPKHIYIDPDVNAYVSYTNTWLSLFLPVRKTLTIGLGLVSCLNLSEFKAVVSHEFGHFAQRTMKIGSYIMSANTIIHDMIFARDKWDEMLGSWKASDIMGLLAAAWVITPVIWLIRQALALFYQLLNVMYSSLSREMEFNADKVAVKTSGSDAIISALWKLDNGFENWSDTKGFAYLAAQKKVFTRNLYKHNLLAIERGVEEMNLRLNNLPIDERGGKHFFLDTELSKVGMYASHPPNDKRENNAKTPYVRCEEDKRSPWVLFQKQEMLEEKMTALFYKDYLLEVPGNFVTTLEFEEFINKETSGKELLKEYYNTFENRFFYIAEVEEIEKGVDGNVSLNKKTLKKLKEKLVTLLKPVSALDELILEAQKVYTGATKGDSFSYKDNVYNKKNIQEGYGLLVQDREELLNNSFRGWDVSFCAFHLTLARIIEGKDIKLLNIYAQHAAITRLYVALINARNLIAQELETLQTRHNVAQVHVNDLASSINNYIHSLNNEIKALEGNTFVPMPNIDNVLELKNSIIEGGYFKRGIGRIFENGDFDRIMAAIEKAIIHCQRIDQKSISLILEFHKELQNELDE